MRGVNLNVEPTNINKYSKMFEMGELLFIDGRGLIEIKLDLRMSPRHIFKTFTEGVDYVVLPFKDESSNLYGYVNIVPIKDVDNFRSRVVTLKEWPEYARHLAEASKDFSWFKGKSVEDIMLRLMKIEGAYFTPCLHLTAVEDLDRDDIYNMPKIEVKR